MVPRGLSFDYLVLTHVPVSPDQRNTLFFLLLLGFGVKAPLFPLHTWLPTVAMEGPVGISALLTGLKLGLYGFLRLAFPLVPEAAREHGSLLGLLGTVGIVYGGLIALRQSNLRRLLAYSSISHAGFVVLGLASFNVQGVQGAVLQLSNFAVVAGGLFLLAGFLHHRLGSTDLANLGGAAKSMPMLASFLFMLGLAGMGVPGTSGFPAEHLILLGAFKVYTGAALAALFGVIVGAAYFLGFFQRAMLGPIRLVAVRQTVDLRPRELTIAMLLVLLVMAGGMFPQPWIGISAPSVRAWVARLHASPDSTAFARAGISTGSHAFPPE
jgi:NADH-quinone oxidoreductase subunit M